MNRGQRVRLTIERPAAGGRMIARHEGAIVFVANAIPGEVVDADIEKVQRGTAWAIARQVIEASPDRLEDPPDGACGGAVFAHIAAPRQRQLKSAIIEDTLRRIGRITLEAPTEVVASPAQGYRMRARLHVRRARIGFFREGSHELCDVAVTGQLREDTARIVAGLERSLATSAPVIAEIELSENIDASQRACHFELLPGADPSRLATLTSVDGLTGATCAPVEHARTMELWGSPYVVDTIAGVRLQRHARSFFQGNRFITAALVEHVLSQLAPGALLDLYAGVGLFSVAAAAAGHDAVAAVEGDRFSLADLKHNAAGRPIEVRGEAVEDFVRRTKSRFETTIVDPPRTGMSTEALKGVVALGTPRVVYVSCDIATLARDARLLLDAGYRIAAVRAFDLFPNTAHIETVISFAR